MVVESQVDAFRGAQMNLLRTVLANMEKVYLSRNPTAKAVMDLLRSTDGNHVCYDHLAMQTFGVDGYCIDSMSKFFVDCGYVRRGELKIPGVRALWFAPPEADDCDYDHDALSCFNGPLPKLVIGEVAFDELSSESQDIIRKYTKTSGYGNKYAALASSLGCITWKKPTYSDFEQLSRESEFAAWTLVNGSLLNHAAVSVHGLKSHIRNMKSLNKFIEDHGFILNSEGGFLKVSPDGRLLQSATVADSTLFTFADGVTESIPSSFIEFTERLILPEYENLAEQEIKEIHRRGGFDARNGTGIMESTSKQQLSRKGASH